MPKIGRIEPDLWHPVYRKHDDTPWDGMGYQIFSSTHMANQCVSGYSSHWLQHPANQETSTVRFRSCEQWITAMVAVYYMGHWFVKPILHLECIHFHLSIYIYPQYIPIISWLIG